VTVYKHACHIHYCIVIMAYKRKRTSRRTGRRLRNAIVPRRNGMRNAAIGLAANLAGRVVRHYAKAGARGVLNRVQAARNRRVASRNQALRSKRSQRVTSMRSGSAEKRSVSTVWGRKPRGMVGRFMRSQLCRLRLTFVGLNRLDQFADNSTTCPGYFLMQNTLGNSATTFGIPPVYVLSLNNTVQNGVYSAPFRGLEVQADGVVAFTPVAGLNTGGGVTTLWQNEAFNPGGDPGGETQFIANEWMSVRFLLYGARTQQTHYKIHLVQCAEEDTAPEDETGLRTASGVHADRRRDAFYSWWHNLIRPLVTSEIAAKMYPQRPHTSANAPMRILRTWKYDIAPSLNIERDSTANAVVANLFIRDGRVLNYNWQQSSEAYDATRTSVTGGIDDLLPAPARQIDLTRTTEPPLDNPNPKARRYLIITASNPTGVLTGETQDNTPSFDMVVRKSEIRGQNTAT